MNRNDRSQAGGVYPGDSYPAPSACLEPSSAGGPAIYPSLGIPQGPRRQRLDSFLLGTYLGHIISRHSSLIPENADQVAESVNNLTHTIKSSLEYAELEIGRHPERKKPIKWAYQRRSSIQRFLESLDAIQNEIGERLATPDYMLYMARQQSKTAAPKDEKLAASTSRGS